MFLVGGHSDGLRLSSPFIAMASSLARIKVLRNAHCWQFTTSRPSVEAYLVEYLDSLEFYVLAMIDYNLPNSRPVAMKQNSLHVGAVAVVCLKNHTGVTRVVKHHSASVYLCAFFCTPQSDASIEHCASGKVYFPPVVEHKNISVEYFFHVVVSWAKVIHFFFFVFVEAVAIRHLGRVAVYTVAEKVQRVFCILRSQPP